MLCYTIWVGYDIVITNKEVEIAKSFYELQGQSEEDAEKSAVKYMEEFSAMYVEAINNGFDVTQEEVEEYVAGLKETAKEAANSEDVYKVISQFESEEEYWEYQKEVCKKQLPIQKYVKSLEQEYSEKIGKEINDEETTDSWNKELEKIKEKAAKNQKFKLK